MSAMKRRPAGFLLALSVMAAAVCFSDTELGEGLLLPGVPETANQFGREGESIEEEESSEEEDEGTEEGAEFDTPLNALSACLMDAQSGRVLYEKNGYQEMPMASTTKIMTCLVVLENTSPDEVVTVSHYASTMPDVQLGITEGEQYYVGDLLYSLMLESHNDVAVALAEHVGGSVEEFCDMMTARAKAMGAYHTSFQTPNGLDAEGHYTTAADLARIGSFALTNEEFVAITNTASHTFQEISGKRSFTVNNKNRFLDMMDGAIGIKTGFTGKAGYCFVGGVKREDRTLVSVVLGCGWPPNRDLKWADTTALMEYGLEHYEVREVFEEDPELAPAAVYGGKEREAKLSCIGSLALLMRADEEVTVEYRVVSGLTAPFSQGTQAGTADYYVDGELVASFPILTAEAVERIDFAFCLRWAMENFCLLGNGRQARTGARTRSLYSLTLLIFFLDGITGFLRTDMI